MGISNFPTRFKADFGLFRPFQLPADMTQYGRYGPILAESARFGVNKCESKPNWRESSQVGANPRGKKKKLKRGTDSQATVLDAASCVGLRCGTLPAASVLSSLPTPWIWQPIQGRTLIHGDLWKATSRIHLIEVVPNSRVILWLPRCQEPI